MVFLAATPLSTTEKSTMAALLGPHWGCSCGYRREMDRRLAGLGVLILVVVAAAVVPGLARTTRRRFRGAARTSRSTGDR